MMNFLRKNIKYPHSAMELGLQGIVYVSFVIDTSGLVTDVKVNKGISRPNLGRNEQDKKLVAEYEDALAKMNEEAMRIFRIMPKWGSGKIDGKKVKVFLTYPIFYKMQ